MDWVQIDGKEIPLLEAPQKHEDVPRRILYVIFKHKRLITTIFLGLSVPVFLYWLFTPTEYLAKAKVFIKPSREFLNVSPANMQGRREDGIGILPSRELINSEIQIIKSPQLLERLVEDVPFPERAAGTVPRNLSQAQIRRDARKMKGKLDATSVRNSNLIEVSIASPYPQEWTARAVNRAAELYLEEHLKVHKTPGIGEFYDAQQKRLRDDLAVAEETLRKFQEKEKIVDAPQEVTSDLAALAAFEKHLKETDSSLHETEQRIAMLENQLKQQKATIPSNTNIGVNPVYQKTRDRITQLELEKDSLLQRYTAEDRLVKDKQKEIDELKKKLETMKPTSVELETISINEVHRRILNELLAARVNLRALTEKKAVLTRQVESYSAAAADKKRKGFEYDRLLRQVNTKKESLDLYMKKAEEARISDAMDDQKFSNAYILERANPPLPKAGWNFILLMLAALLGSAGAAIAAAFGVEYFNRTLRNERDIEEQIGLPVLATIQYYGDFRPVPSE